MKEIHLLTLLKCLPERQEAVGILCENKSTSGHHFCILLLSYRCSPCGGTFSHLPTPSSYRHGQAGWTHCPHTPQTWAFRHHSRTLPRVFNPYSTPPYLVGTWNSHKGCSLSIWLWWPRGMYYWFPHIWNNWRDSLWQATTPRALHKHQTTIHLQSSCKKGLSSCPGASGLRRRF